MAQQATAVIQRETAAKPVTKEKAYYASLALIDKDGHELGLPRNFASYEEVGKLLQREAKVPYEVLNGSRPHCDQGKPVSIRIIVEDQDILHLGFDPGTPEIANLG